MERLLLRPSFRPWATALVSRLSAAVPSAVSWRIWSGFWLVHAMHAASAHAIKADKKARPGMLFRCLYRADGWHATTSAPTFLSKTASIVGCRWDVAAPFASSTGRRTVQ